MENKAIKITENVYIYPFFDEIDRPNIGYIKGKNKSLLVDVGGNEKILNEALEAFRKEGLREPHIAILTHNHWDHTFAMSYFEGIIYASNYTNEVLQNINNHISNDFDSIYDDELVPIFCKKDLEKCYEKCTDIKLKKVDEIVETELTLNLCKQDVVIIPCVSSHTKGTLLVYAKNDKVLFVGDADCGRIVGMDFIEDIAKLKQFKEVVENIDAKYVVQGHTEIYTKEDFLTEIEEILEEKE